MLHPLLVRQLRRLHLDHDTPPADAAQWQTFLDRVGKAYREADEDRYLLERSLRLSSDEMQQLNDSLRADIAERGRIQEALERERRQLLSIIRSAPIPIAMLDTGLRYLAWSTRWLTTYGLDGEDLTGRAAYEHLGDVPERWRAVYERVLQGEVLSQAEDVFERGDGTRVHIRWALHPWYTVDGAIGGVVIVSDRIDDLVEAREHALEAARLKSEFLANMSHEIRTPVNVVIGMADMLLDSPLDAEERSLAETMRRSAVGLLGILNDVLDFSKIEAGRLELERIAFDPHTLVEDVVELLAESAQRKGFEIASVAAPDVPPSVEGDPGRVRQVLLNLVGNAVKFTERGEVTATVRVERAAADEVVLRFEVRDTGIGIAPEAQARIFDPFVQADGSMTRRYGGTGLGLAISKRLVALLGGRIGVHGAPGVGSTFWVSIPFAHAADAEAAPEPPAACRGRGVLVACDLPTVRQLLCVGLEQIGMRVVAADTSGALGVLRTAAVMGEPFDVALVDAERDGDGLDVVRACRAERALGGLALVVLAPMVRRPSAEALRAAGADACLVKPVRRAVLQAQLERLLVGRAAARPRARALAAPQLGIG